MAAEQIVRLRIHVPFEPSLTLETYVVPICRFDIGEGKAVIRTFHGTAFFVGESGTFLTARHVIEDAITNVRNHGGFVGLCGKAEDFKSNRAIPIQNSEFAPAPYDVAVGTTNYRCQSVFTVEKIEVAMWADVAMLGYPSSTLVNSNGAIWMYLRGFKGYVQRTVSPEALPLSTHPCSFEASFPIARGMSGAPLFVHAGRKDIVVGVCVGSNRSETLDYEYVDVDEAGRELRESIRRIEEYGLAHDIRPLVTWSPALLEGKTLGEVSYLT